MIGNSALYLQLMKSIREKILQGELKAGDKLESERSMALQYGINRQTVRHALKALEEEGLVRTYHGKGTFVQSVPKLTKVELGSGSIISLSHEIRQKGYKSSREVLRFGKVPNTGFMKEHFRESQYLFELVRLSKIDNQPYAVQQAFVPMEVFPDAERYDFANGSLYEYMEIHGRYPKRLASHLKVVSLPKEYAELLNHDVSKKVFLFDYLGYDKDDVLVEYTFSYHLPQYSSYKYSIGRG